MPASISSVPIPQFSAATTFKQEAVTAGGMLNKFNINVKEHNQSFSHSSQVKPASPNDVHKPNPNANNMSLAANNSLPDPEGPGPIDRGGALDITV